MYSTQPQLLQIPLDPGDVVYTPDWVARDMVEYFKPTGRILEPCAGDGAFLKYLPGADWCEITKGRDFFACHEHYDWIVGNPPFRQFDRWLQYSYVIAQHIIYLIPADKPFNSLPRARLIAEMGGIIQMCYYTDGPQMEMPEVHRPMAAFHFQRGYTGPINVVFRDRSA